MMAAAAKLQPSATTYEQALRPGRLQLGISIAFANTIFNYYGSNE